MSLATSLSVRNQRYLLLLVRQSGAKLKFVFGLVYIHDNVGKRI